MNMVNLIQTRPLLLFFVFLSCALPLHPLHASLDTHTVPQEPSGRTAPCTVTAVKNGHTLTVDIPPLGEMSVRLIGIEAPEVEKNRESWWQARNSRLDINDIYAMGYESADFLKTLLQQGDSVILELDTKKINAKGQLLAYVWKDGKMLNAEILRFGYAVVDERPPNMTHSWYLYQICIKAQDGQRGLFSKHLWRSP